MHTRPTQRRISWAIPILSIAALLVVCCGTATAAVAGSASHLSAHQRSVQRATPKRSPLAGTWSGKYSGAFSGSFTLHWKLSGSILSGSITLSNPSGTYGIKGKVRGSAISFGAVGVGATYTGSVSGKSMSGRYNSPQGGGRWSARKIA